MCGLAAEVDAIRVQFCLTMWD